MYRLGCLLAAILVTHVPTSTHAHGRMLEPGSRPSGYLKGLAMPPNYNDHEMNCGGRAVHWQQNEGKCGICGDPWSGPRHYERPDGLMVQHNIITETYLQNQIIVVKLQITAAHMGDHQFFICDVAKSGGVEATPECLKENILADENGVTTFTKGTTKAGLYEYLLVLPPWLTCKHCVFQWKWRCGNDWGCGKSGCCTGCGEVQEHFYSCADITIKPRGLYNSTSTTTTTTTRPTTTTWRYPSTRTSTTRQPTTYSTYRSTRQSRGTTYNPTTRSTTTVRSSTSKYQNNVIYNYWKNQTKNDPSGTSIRFPTRSYSLNETKISKLYMDMIIGRHSFIVNQEGLSIPVPVDDNNTSSQEDYSDIIDSSPTTKDRFCAACSYSGCFWSLCDSKCPDYCKSNSSGRQLG